MMEAIYLVVKSQYLQTALKYMFIRLFFALLRVGKFTAKKQLPSNEHVIQVSDVEYEAIDVMYVT